MFLKISFFKITFLNSSIENYNTVSNAMLKKIVMMHANGSLPKNGFTNSISII